METAKVIKTDDLDYKKGFVQCACGWRKELGDGFNGYHIATCPKCDPTITIRHQERVVWGTKTGMNVEIGDNQYFVLSNGIHVRYAANIRERYTGLTPRQAALKGTHRPSPRLSR
jgi:hypothetical protein